MAAGAARKAQGTGANGGRQTSLAEFVQGKVREAIQAGRYGPGERLRETEVADWLAVSRTPVREALRRLEAEGLLTFEPWRGVVVAELDRRQVTELYAMRTILEGAAARLAAQHVGEAEIELMAGLLARAKTAGDDAEALAAINRRFHQAIYTGAHNRYLLQSLETLRNALALLRGTTFAVPGRAKAAHREHAAILAAIKARDADRAEQAARDHIRAAERARVRLLFELEGPLEA
ncbi:MAG: GntR family transcriptional regulator [Kiloniellales bacterium]|nr:GntR family transcriptional regulator [Kiloniellales bacterium]